MKRKALCNPGAICRIFQMTRRKYPKYGSVQGHNQFHVVLPESPITGSHYSSDSGRGTPCHVGVSVVRMYNPQQVTCFNYLPNRRHPIFTASSLTSTICPVLFTTVVYCCAARQFGSRRQKRRRVVPWPRANIRFRILTPFPMESQTVSTIAFVTCLPQ